MKNKKRRRGLTLYIVIYVFVIMLAAMFLASTFLFFAHHLGLVEFNVEILDIDFPRIGGLFWLALFSTVIGTTLTATFSRQALKPLHKIIAATNKVAQGDFSVTVESKGIQELEELADSFNQMTRELSSIETLRSDFINNFSHEFKTPIVSIRGFAKLLIEENLSEEDKHEYLNIILAESERLANLSTNILNLTKYEAIEIITEKKPFRLDEQIRRAILLTEPKWSKKEINMDIKLDEITWSYDADITHHIWLNLLDNAIKFTKPGGNIVVTLSDTPSAILFCIRDDGVGMDENTAKHIFDKFYQGDKSHKQTGYGLGLAITKRIVTLCGGTISAESNPDEGSMFTVRLPHE
ncbi:MAG: HAMP domain-containing histidine kinase [Defluviitaleaceae bacterium]|nr:HAMP domain-containing histidine kinase [Defluviitaleaceae bacterium]